MRWVLSPLAQSDIDRIWDHSAASWGFDQAEVYVREINKALGTLSVEPRLGRASDEVRAGYRKYRVGSHFLFYRIIGDGIDVVRILHQSMDFERHL